MIKKMKDFSPDDIVLRKSLDQQKIAWWSREQANLQQANEDVLGELAYRNRNVLQGTHEASRTSTVPELGKTALEIALEQQLDAFRSANQTAIQKTNEQLLDAQRQIQPPEQ